MAILFAVTGLSGPDYFMLIGYFALMVGIGVYFYRYMRGMKAFFTGGSQIPWWLAGVSFYMSSFRAYAFVVFSGLCFTFGWVGITLFWVSVPATLFSVMLFSSLWRRARTVSPVEFLEARYSGPIRQIFAWGGLPTGLIDDSLKLVATATIMNVGLGIPIEWMIVACGIIIISYCFMGGLWAVTVTDFVQFAILAIAVLAIFPLAIAKAGGLTGFAAYAPTGVSDFVNEKYNWFYLLMLLGMYCVAWSSSNWHLIQKYFCVATEKDAKKVGLLVMALYIVGPPLILIPAIAARYFLPAETVEMLSTRSREVYPQICIALLPVGMLGLVIAAMFSSTMGNLSSHFNVWASVLTNDVYRRLFRPHAGDRELVAVGRGMTLLVGILTVGAALLLRKASADDLFGYMVLLFRAFVPPFGIPMLLGLVSRRVNTMSVYAAIVGCAVVDVIMFTMLDRSGNTFGVAWQLPSVVFGVSTVLTLSLTFGVSALFPTGEAERRRVEAFHKRLATPIGGLPEDRPADAVGAQPMSPFRIVGICISCMGAMMLGITPWIDKGTAAAINAVLGTGLLVLGVLMAWASIRAQHRAEERLAASARDTD